MAFPFSLGCGCCLECRACPCESGQAASSLQFMFEDWAASPAGYCSSCEALNTTIEVPEVDDFGYGVGFGDNYRLVEPKAACDIFDPEPGSGCRFAVDELFDCVPQACLDSCISQCIGNCTESGECSPENCEDYICGSDNACFYFGGTCEIECSQNSVCVFDEELDPEHLAGICATVGDCTSSVVEGTCAQIRLRIRAMFYVTEDRKAAVSVQVLLFGRTIGGFAAALNLWGFHEFDEETLDCGAVDVDVALFPVSGYSQPALPACGAPTSVRITGLP
jgi:hypothetical protein